MGCALASQPRRRRSDAAECLVPVAAIPADDATARVAGAGLGGPGTAVWLRQVWPAHTVLAGGEAVWWRMRKGAVWRVVSRCVHAWRRLGPASRAAGRHGSRGRWMQACMAALPHALCGAVRWCPPRTIATACCWTLNTHVCRQIDMHMDVHGTPVATRCCVQTPPHGRD